ncbi:hypothetical protein [Geothrix sp. SG200]|uniref:hypothetical protein n=1 Tax=Geothrix sp. SG200 TaxID=2922865 RepID=UPI001FAB4F0C|nr:hypothetical protein [Geothrix sp. SG200]
MPDPEGKSQDNSNPLGLTLVERLAKIREQMRRIAGTNSGDTGSSANVRTIPDWIWGPFEPIPDPGPTEARFLQAHPDWAVSHPWRLLSARDGDIRHRQLIEAAAAQDHWEFMRAMERVEESIFREVIDIEVARVGATGGPTI